MAKIKFDVTEYWAEPPPKHSERCEEWLVKIANGWKPNRRISQMGYHEKAEFFGVYIWEYLNLIRPALGYQ
jgi:hypothetical protein